MAANDTKEVQAQLDLQMQINQVLQGRMSILKAQEKALSSQVQLAVDMCKALKCEGLDDIEARLKTAREEMQRAAEQAEELGAGFSKIGEEGADSAERATSATKKLTDQLTAGKGAAVGLGIGLVRGFGSAIQTATNLTSGLMGIVGTLGNLAVSIASLPFKLLGNLFSMAQAGGGGGPSPIRVELEKIRGEFGDLATSTGKVAAGALDQFRNQLTNLAGTGLSVRKVFGRGREGLAKAMAENAELMKALGPAVGHFTDVLSTSAVALSMYRKALGMTAEQQAKLMKMSEAMGKDFKEEQLKMASMAINMGKSFGIPAKLIGKDMAEMSSDFANFGTLSTKTLAQASVFTRKLGIEIKALTGMISGFDDFETAALNAAKLSQAFGMNIDAMKMMQEQDPAARLSMMQKAFKETGRSIESMSRQELKLLAAQSGLSEEDAAMAFSKKGLSQSYDDITKAGAKSEKNQLTQAEAMAELADSIERVFGSGGGTQFTGFFDAFSKGFETGIMKSMEFRSAMKAIRQALKAVWYGGIEIGKMFVKFFPGIKGMLTGLKDLFNPERFRRLMASVKNIFSDFFKDLQTDPKAGVEKFLKRFKDLFKSFFSASGPGISTIMEGGKTFLKTMAAMFKAVMPIVIDGLVSAVNAITEFIREPPGMPDALSGLLDDLGSALIELLSALWERLAPALGKMFMALFEKVGPWIAKAGGAILAVSIGKTVLSAIFTGLGGGIVATAGKAISSFFTKASELGSSSAEAGPSRGIGAAIGNSISSIAEGIKTSVKAINEINPADIVTAGLRLALMTVMLIPAIAVLAGLLTVLAKRFTPESAITAGLAMAAIGVAAVSIKFMIEATKSITLGAVGKAIAGALAAAGFIVTGVLVLAVSIKLIEVAFRGIDWLAVGTGMVAMAIAMVAIGVMMGAAFLLGTVMVSSFGTAGIAIAAGIAAAAAFVVLLAGFLIVINETLLPALDLANFEASLPKISALGKFFDVLGGMAVLTLRLGSFDSPRIKKLITGGFDQIEKFGEAIRDKIAPVVAIISELDMNPSTMLAQLDAVSKVIDMIGTLGSVASSIASIDVGLFSSATPETNLTAASNFINTLISGIQRIVTSISGTTLSAEQIRSASQFGEVFKVIGNLVKSLRPDPQLMATLIDDDSYFSDSTAERVSALTTHMGNMIDVVSEKMGAVLTKITDATSKLPSNPDEMMPKLKILSSSFGVLGSFVNIISTLSKEILGESSSTNADVIARKFTKFGTVVNGITSALFPDDANMSFSGMITKLTNLIEEIPDPGTTMETKINSLVSMFEILSKFTSMIKDISGLIPPSADENSEMFVSRISILSSSISLITSALRTSFLGVFRTLRIAINLIPGTEGGELKEFERKGKALAAVFDIMSKFSSSMSDVSSLAKTSDGAIDTTALTNIISSVTDAIAVTGGGAISTISSKIIELTNDPSISALSKHPGKIKTLGSVFKSMSDFAGAMKVMGDLGAATNPGGVADHISNIALLFGSEGSTRLQTSLGHITRGLRDIMGEIRGGINTRGLTAYAENVSTAITALENIAGPSGSVAERVTALGAAFTSMKAEFLRLNADEELALAVEVGRGLTGNGTLTVRHEAANINLHVNIEMSAEQIARGIIQWNNTNPRGTSQEFVLTNSGNG